MDVKKKKIKKNTGINWYKLIRRSRSRKIKWGLYPVVYFKRMGMVVMIHTQAHTNIYIYIYTHTHIHPRIYHPLFHSCSYATKKILPMYVVQEKNIKKKIIVVKRTNKNSHLKSKKKPINITLDFPYRLLQPSMTRKSPKKSKLWKKEKPNTYKENKTKKIHTRTTCSTTQHSTGQVGQRCFKKFLSTTLSCSLYSHNKIHKTWKKWNE